MKFFVTGAGGFVGSAVVAEAIACGYDVVAALRNISNVDERLNGATSEQLDLRDAENVKSALMRHRPDVLVHSAWRGVSNRTRNDLTQITDNVTVACNLMCATAEAGIRKFIGIGSQAEYGAINGRISETALPVPASLYGASKLAAMVLTRQLAAQSDIDFIWMRLFSTYGPGDNAFWLIPSLIEQMLGGISPQMTTGEQLWDYLYIDDVARGIIAVAVGETAGVFNLGCGQSIAIKTIAAMLRDIISPEMPINFGSIAHTRDQIWHMEANIDALIAATGWVPRIDLKTGLFRTIEWHRRMNGKTNA